MVINSSIRYGFLTMLFLFSSDYGIYLLFKVQFRGKFEITLFSYHSHSPFTQITRSSILLLVSPVFKDQFGELYIVGCRGVRQLGGLVPVIRLGVPPEYKAWKLCNPQSYQLGNERTLV